MPDVFNQFRQPVGVTLSDRKSAPFPQTQRITSRYYKLERINVKYHTKELYEAYYESSDCHGWTYLAVELSEVFDAFQVYLKKAEEQTDPMHFTIIDLTNMKPVGMFALMRIDPANSVVKVGHVSYSVRMKRSRISTEVILSLLEYVFEDLDYRRFEWKCDALNAPSRGTAEYSDFGLEDIFRQAVVTWDHNRDTAWYSVVDEEYPTLRPAYDLQPDERNFDNQGRQIEHLGELTERGWKLSE